MADEEKIKIDIREELIIKVSLPEHLTGEFVNMVRGILSVTTGENYEKMTNNGPFYLVIRIHPDKQFRFYKLLTVFCEMYSLAFERPSPLRFKEEIQEVREQAQIATDVFKKKASTKDLGNMERETVLSVISEYHGVLHALSWVLNEGGIGQITPCT